VDERLQEFPLCQFCRDRQGAGEFEFPRAKNEKCFICGGISENLEGITKRVLSRMGRYEFRTFSIGLILPNGVQEREDTLRSDLKIRGGETIKSERAARIAQSLAKGLRGGKKVDKLHPDATVLVDIAGGTAEVTSKPLFLYGLYTKPRRVGQRRLFCEHCNGRGCERCDGSGYSSVPSVEGLVSKRLEILLGSRKFKFTWFGSEDADSIVFPPGRPMFIEAKNPRWRHLPRTLKLRTGRGGISISGLRVVARRSEHPGFTFETRAVIRAERRVTDEDVTRLKKGMKNVLVQYRNNKGKLVDKRIYFVKAKARGKRITADVKLEGGLPVKRLVSGEAVSPSFSESMGTPLRCERFDILRVWPRREKVARN